MTDTVGKRYNWLPGESVKGIIEPIKPSDGLPSGPVVTAEERAVWRALWTDRLARMHADGGTCGHRPACPRVPA